MVTVWLPRDPLTQAAEPRQNQGAQAQTSEPEWRFLFDGSSTDAWRSFGRESFPAKGWEVEDGILKKPRRSGGGNIVTKDTFWNFDFRWEWRIPPGANNGVKYMVLEERGRTLGHEYQMIDDTRGGNPIHTTASFYAVLPARTDRKPTRIGEWNKSRILVRGNHVEHWLNGEKIVSYELGSPEVLAGVAKSKFKTVDGFGTKVRGRIMLTDHGDEAWFRNIRIRELTPESP